MDRATRVRPARPDAERRTCPSRRGVPVLASCGRRPRPRRHPRESAAEQDVERISPLCWPTPRRNGTSTWNCPPGAGRLRELPQADGGRGSGRGAARQGRGGSGRGPRARRPRAGAAGRRARPRGRLRRTRSPTACCSSSATCGRRSAAAGSRSSIPKGEKFDPNFAEALSTVQVEGTEAGVVVEVMQKGYRFEGHLIRPAMVVVAA